MLFTLAMFIMLSQHPQSPPANMQRVLQAALDSPLLDKTIQQQSPGEPPPPLVIVTNQLIPANLTLTRAGKAVRLYPSADKAGGAPPFMVFESVEADAAKAILQFTYGEAKVAMTLRNRAGGWAVARYKATARDGKRTFRLFSTDVEF